MKYTSLIQAEVEFKLCAEHSRRSRYPDEDNFRGLNQ